MVRHPSPLQPGDVLHGRYRIGRELGRGGMGVVHRAVQLGLGRAVAVKIVFGHASGDERTRARFLREAKVACLLRHPGAVEVYDFGEHERGLFLVMELLTGLSLTRHLHTNGFPSFPELCRVGARIADVLAAAHELPLVHRDLKPENIILEPVAHEPTQPKLVDFGLAFIEGQGELGRLTTDGMVSGTPEFLSPEQAQGLELGPPTDIYSLGVILYLLAARELPFRGGLADLIAQHAFAAPRPLTTRQLGTPQALSDLVDHMLAKTPGDRPTASEVARALSELDPNEAPRAGRQGLAAKRAGTERYAPILAQPLGREDRVIDPPDQTAETADLVEAQPPASRHVGVIEELEPSVVAALALAGFEVHGLALDALDAPDAEPVTVADVLFLPHDEATAPRCARWPIVARMPAEDLDLAQELLRRGVLDAIEDGADPAAIARRIKSAHRRHQRRTNP